jgi:hypothetical protein
MASLLSIKVEAVEAGELSDFNNGCCGDFSECEPAEEEELSLVFDLLTDFPLLLFIASKFCQM